MGLNDTPSGERIHIGFFGMCNSGKSSLINRITSQQVSLVSDISGTTTDPVKKAMELLPLGPVVFIDTPGFDDTGALGSLRVKRTRETLDLCDASVLVTENDSLNRDETELLDLIKKRNIPYFIVRNKTDLGIPDPDSIKNFDMFRVSALTGDGIEELKEKIASSLSGSVKQIRYIADLIDPGDTVVLVIPIDTSAPKGRLILPQQLALRDILDADAVSVVTGVERLPETLDKLKRKPALVITDSQVFSRVMKLVPEDIPLTSFSILMARYKGFLDTALKGAMAIDNLKDGASVLISEGCTHHRQCGDIGTVKLPAWLNKYTGKKLNFSYTQGHGFPDDISSYDLIVHCGGCMLNDAEMHNRMDKAVNARIPFTNYGIAIARMNGILDRCSAPLIRCTAKDPN